MNKELFFNTLRHYDHDKWVCNGWEDMQYAHWQKDPDLLIVPIKLLSRHPFIKYLDSQWSKRHSRKIEYETYTKLLEYEYGERREMHELRMRLKKLEQEKIKFEKQIAMLVNNKYKLERKINDLKK